MSAANELRELTRRTFLKGTLATAAMLGAGSTFRLSEAVAQTGVRRASMWLGPDFWANRLQDWMLRDGRIECIAPAGQGVGRTVALLTSSLGDGPVILRTRTGSLRPGAGFSGFLIGAGTPEADPRTAALVLSASGEGGGLYAIYDADGRVRFREHTDERNQFAYAEIPSEQSGPAPPRRADEDVELRLTITPDRGGARGLSLRASDAATGELLSSAELRGVDPAAVRGGLSLVSSDSGNSGARYWFRDIRASGRGVARHPDRALGPVAGTLFSITGSTLKMTVQMMPDASFSGREVVLETRRGGGAWSRRASAPVGSGFTALIRAEDWDTSRAHDYRVVPPNGAPYNGTIPAEPRGRELVIGSINCIKTSERNTDAPTDGRPRLPNQKYLGLYTDRNVYFPHDRLAANVASHGPDLLVAHGDQLYEGNPSRKDTSAAPELDFLYKYLLWLWSFRDLTRSTPTVIMVDDHDVYQGNIWGEGGAPATQGQNGGGYVNAPEWVNVV